MFEVGQVTYDKTKIKKNIRFCSNQTTKIQTFSNESEVHLFEVAQGAYDETHDQKKLTSVFCSV